jgi:molybdopterin-binding protein
MKLSARNQLRGKVVSVKEGAVEAQVVVDVGGFHVVSVVTVDAVKELGLTADSEVVAVIKADSVMLAVD